MICGPAEIVIVAVALLVASETLVAVTVAEFALTLEAAVNVVEAAVLPESAPPPEVVQVTPWFAASPDTDAVRGTVCPASIVGVALEMETVMLGCRTVIETEVAVTVTGVVAASVTETLKLKVPAAVGVPAIAPEVLLSASPVGRAPLAIAKLFVPVPPLADVLASL